MKDEIKILLTEIKNAFQQLIYIDGKEMPILVFQAKDSTDLETCFGIQQKVSAIGGNDQFKVVIFTREFEVVGLTKPSERPMLIVKTKEHNAHSEKLLSDIQNHINSDGKNNLDIVLLTNYDSVELKKAEVIDQQDLMIDL